MIIVFRINGIRIKVTFLANVGRTNAVRTNVVRTKLCLPLPHPQHAYGTLCSIL